MGFGVQGLGFKVCGLGFGVDGLQITVEGVRITRVEGLGNYAVDVAGRGRDAQVRVRDSGVGFRV